jgi:hypothetical protein
LRFGGKELFTQKDSMDQPGAVKVLIVNEEGQYLAGTATAWGFTDERSQARVFDYWQDHVPEMLALVKNAHAEVWIAVKLDAYEADEFCDRCGSRISALTAFFTGKEFLCIACRGADVSDKERRQPDSG